MVVACYYTIEKQSLDSFLIRQQAIYFFCSALLKQL